MIKSYAETDIFTEQEIQDYQNSSALVDSLGREFSDVRCHELARAVGLVLDLPFQDGYFEMVDHTWLWTRELTDKEQSFMYKSGNAAAGPHIIDVYTPGCVPMVQLVDTNSWQLPYKRSYRPGQTRIDIRDSVVSRLLESFK